MGMIMREFIERVYMNTRATKIRGNTLQGYLSTINKHILPYFGAMGHSDVRMTYDHYVRPREEAFRKMQRDIWR